MRGRYIKTGINTVKLKSLKKTKKFYLYELKRSDSLTESERSKYLVALKSINRIICQKELSGEKEKVKYFSKKGGDSMISKKNIKLGARVIKNKNPFINVKGGIDLIERFPGIDFIPYEKRRIKKSKEKR